VYQLAHRIILEAHKRKRIGGEIVLSAEVTGMPRATRWRAIKDLVRLGLIEIEQNGHAAPRVTRLLNLPCGWNHAPEEVL
jgi:hypothetical protein